MLVQRCLAFEHQAPVIHSSPQRIWCGECLAHSPCRHGTMRPRLVCLLVWERRIMTEHGPAQWPSSWNPTQIPKHLLVAEEVSSVLFHVHTFMNCPHSADSDQQTAYMGDVLTSPSHTSEEPLMSKNALTHTFKRLRAPSRCRECDNYVYFNGYECEIVCILYSPMFFVTTSVAQLHTCMCCP